MKALAVLGAEPPPTFRRSSLELDVPFAVISQTPSLANRGKSVGVETVTPVAVQARKPLDLGSKFVRSSSMSKPFF
jgi:hypothetical protein